jgi:hypothetical protein
VAVLQNKGVMVIDYYKFWAFHVLQHIVNYWIKISAEERQIIGSHRTKVTFEEKKKRLDNLRTEAESKIDDQCFALSNRGETFSCNSGWVEGMAHSLDVRLNNYEQVKMNLELNNYY